jgi:hypothetical protein
MGHGYCIGCCEYFRLEDGSYDALKGYFICNGCKQSLIAEADI